MLGCRHSVGIFWKSSGHYPLREYYHVHLSFLGTGQDALNAFVPRLLPHCLFGPYTKCFACLGSQNEVRVVFHYGCSSLAGSSLLLGLACRSYLVGCRHAQQEAVSLRRFVSPSGKAPFYRQQDTVLVVASILTIIEDLSHGWDEPFKVRAESCWACARTFDFIWNASGSLRSTRMMTPVRLWVFG